MGTGEAATPESGHGPRTTPRDAASAGSDDSTARRQRQTFVTESYPEGARVVVVVRGELDYDAIAPLTYTLRNALHRSVRGVDVDLRAVRFWDCSALNVLLRLRQEALADGRTVAIRSPSPIVKRVLALTGTSPLFAHSRGEAETHQEM